MRDSSATLSARQYGPTESGALVSWIVCHRLYVASSHNDVMIVGVMTSDMTNDFSACFAASVRLYRFLSRLSNNRLCQKVHTVTVSRIVIKSSYCYNSNLPVNNDCKLISSMLLSFVIEKNFHFPIAFAVQANDIYDKYNTRVTWTDILTTGSIIIWDMRQRLEIVRFESRLV